MAPIVRGGPTARGRPIRRRPSDRAAQHEPGHPFVEARLI